MNLPLLASQARNEPTSTPSLPPFRARDGIPKEAPYGEPPTYGSVLEQAGRDSLNEVAECLFRDLEPVFEMAKTTLSVWGADAQERMIYEELGELIVALAQCRRGRGTPKQEVVDEAADVIIVALEAVALAGARFPDIANALRRKLIRLDGRIHNPEQHTSRADATGAA